MHFPGPTWIGIPRSDRRLHSFVERFEVDGERSLRIPKRETGRVFIENGTLCDTKGEVRDGDLLVFTDLKKEKLVLYMVLRIEVGSPTSIKLQQFKNWLGAFGPEDSEVDWWVETLNELTDKLHDVG